eukprot:6357353-Prymnesium_polylepis.1
MYGTLSNVGHIECNGLSRDYRDPRCRGLGRRRTRRRRDRHLLGCACWICWKNGSLVPSKFRMKSASSTQNVHAAVSSPGSLHFGDGRCAL